MQFANIQILNLLWLVLPLFFILRAFDRQRKKIAYSLIEKRLFSEIVLVPELTKYRKKNILILCSFVLLVTALARPQWGFEWQEVKRQGLDILLVIDTSKSMLTQDVKPNRLERTKLAVKDMLGRLIGDRVGLIAFAGDALLMCPLTVDYDGFLLSLNDLSVDSVPRGGTNLSEALKEAIKGYEDVPNQYKAIIMITDGDNLEGDPKVLAEQAKSENIRIYTVGVGTKEGELIKIDDPSSDSQFLKDSNGNFVKSRLNEGVLQEIALLTGGVYAKASGVQFGLDAIYDQELSKLEKRDIEGKIDRRYFERFQIPLAIGLLLLIFEMFVGVLWKK